MFDSSYDRPHEELHPPHFKTLVVSVVEVYILIRTVNVFSLHPCQPLGSRAARGRHLG